MGGSHYVIALFRPGTLSTNRGNDLLVKLLKFRYPHVIDSVTVPLLRQWLNAGEPEREQLKRKHETNSGFCVQQLKKYMEENSNGFPMLIGSDWHDAKRAQMALFLVFYIISVYHH